MSEIEKLYENAGVEPRCIGCYYNLPCCRNCNKNYKDTINKTCKYQIVKEEYPPFTAEKQLELIKWLGKNKNNFGLFYDGTERLSCHCDFDCEWFEKNFYAECFDNALTGLINTLWQDLTEEEKEEIKEILK